MRTRMLTIATILLSPMIASQTGCQTQTSAQHQAQVIHDTDKAALADLRTCTAEVHNAPGYERLRPHVPPNGQWTLEQLTDSNLATDEEIRALYAEHPKIAACRQQFLNRLATVTPGYVPIFTANWDRSEDALVKLVQKKITWGDYATVARSVSRDIQSAAIAEEQRINAGLKQSHEAEIARRQAAAAAILQFSQTQQMINASSKPVVTNCSAYGNSTTCVTH